jgi:hypothetical protein
VERPDKFLEVVYCDIGFGDCKSIGNGALYCITLVDRATRYSWICPLKSLHHETLKSTLQQWLIDCGGCSSRMYTDFDPKILEGPTACFLRDKNIILRGAPSGRQNKTAWLNGRGRLPPIWHEHLLLICRCQRLFGTGLCASQFK